MTPSVTEEATTASAGDNGACSNGRSRKDECSGVEGSRTKYRDFSKMRSLCNGDR